MKFYRFMIGAALLPSIIQAQTIQNIPLESPPADIAATVAEATADAEKGGLGPFPAVMETVPGLPTHTLYHPKNIAAALAKGGKLPIVAWGNGACTNIGNRFRYFLTEIASHGYLVLATGPMSTTTAEWKVDLYGNDPRPPTQRPANSFAMQQIDAINWAIAENSRKGSPFFGKLNTQAIAVMGQSCGGLQTVASAADPRVKTAIIWNSGTFPEGTPPLSGTGDANKSSLKRFHTPVAYISGDERDIAYKNSNADFDAINHVPVFRAWKIGVGHAESYRLPRGGPFSPVGAAWLNWQLKHDMKAAKMFTGKDCTLCTDKAWVVKRKGIN